MPSRRSDTIIDLTAKVSIPGAWSEYAVVRLQQTMERHVRRELENVMYHTYMKGDLHVSSRYRIAGGPE